jgi:hypothetical protein
MNYSMRFVVEPGAKVNLRSSWLFNRRMGNRGELRARRANGRGGHVESHRNP